MTVPRVKGRYAPSPTGPLHLGNLRTALLAWLQVRLADGVFVLRIEDLDQPRTKPGAVQAILDDLRWLGLDWDEGPLANEPDPPYHQSECTTLYQKALATLQGRQLVYPCFCSRKDIAAVSSAPHGATPVYPGTCRHDGPFLAEPPPRDGRFAAWRFRVSKVSITFEDQVTGPHSENLALEVGDFVLRRADGLFAYQLAVVIDDARMGITDVLRGADLLSSSARQISLFQSLGYPVPRFWHVPLMVDEDGNRLAKRDASTSLDSLRQHGETPSQIIGRLAASVGLIPEGTSITPSQLLTRLDPLFFRNTLQQATQAFA